MDAITTATAAAQAGVTARTIQAWCRLGAVAAVKAAGRWAIEAGSLARRITIGNRRRTRQEAPVAKPQPIVYSVETMTAIGGNRWQKAGMDRVYLDWDDFAPLEIERYNTGNIASATWNGEIISNSQAGKLLGSISKVWFDTADGKLHARFGWSESRVADRDEVWAAVVAGIRNAIADL